MHGGPGGHALLGVGIRKRTDSETEIDVYDSNFPGQTGTMVFHKEGLTYSWYYDDLAEDESKRWHWGSGKVFSNLNFSTSIVSDFIQRFDPDYAAAEADVAAGKAEVKRNGPFDSNPTIVYIPDPAPGTFTYNGQTVDPQNDEHTSSSSVQEIDPTGDSGTSSSGSTGKAYWVKGNGGKIIFQGLWNSNDAGIEPVTIADDTGSISVYDQSSKRSLSIDLDQKKVTGDLYNNEVVVAEFTDSSSLLHPKAVRITGLGGGKPVSIAQEKNGAITVTGLSIVEYESYTKNFDNQSGDVTENDSKHTSTDGLDPSASYRITENPSDRSMSLQEDADHDGKYEKNIVNGAFPVAHVHTWDAGTVTKAPTCTNPGVRTYTCTSGDGITKAEKIPATGHSFGAWQTVSQPTVASEGTMQRTCSVCGAVEKKTIAKLPATITLNAAGTLPLKVKQKFTGLKATLAEGDSIASVVSAKSKVVKASLSGQTIVLKAGKKKGSTTITVTTAGGASVNLKIKVQKKAVTAKKISGIPKTLTLKKGQTIQLTPSVTPISTRDKVKYKSSKKKVCSVSKRGLIKAKKAGKSVITVSCGKKKVKVKVTVVN